MGNPGEARADSTSTACGPVIRNLTSSAQQLLMKFTIGIDSVAEKCPQVAWAPARLASHGSGRRGTVQTTSWIQDIREHRPLCVRQRTGDVISRLGVVRRAWKSAGRSGEPLNSSAADAHSGGQRW